MANLKITCLGGGSLYFPNAVGELVTTEGLEGSEIVLYDIDAEKVELMAGTARRLADEAGSGCTVRSTVDLADAVDGADFAISSIGGSGADVSRNVYGSRFHTADILIPAKYGIHQLIGDTGGPAGMMMGFRAIPVYLEICREMEKRCPDVMLFNHSNPMAVLMRTIHQYTSINAIGICHGVQGGTGQAARVLGVPPHELQCLWIGTNHYYWFTKVMHKGKDVTEELKRLAAIPPWPDGREMCYRMSEMFGYLSAYPSDSHAIEFYSYLTQLPDGPKDLPYGMGEKSIELKDESALPGTEPAGPEVRAAFFKKYREILDEAQLPSERGTEAVAATIADLAAHRTCVRIANIPNRGSIPNLPVDAEVEVEAVVDARGARGVYMGEAPLVLKGILEKRFAWQELVTDAAVKGDRKLALQALLVDEMAIWPKKAQAMLDELLEASRELLPQFFDK